MNTTGSPAPEPGSGTVTAGGARGNGSHSGTGGYQSYFYCDYPASLVTLVICLCGLVGNGAAIWLMGFRVKRNPYTVYKLNLACADLAFLLGSSVWLGGCLSARDGAALLAPVGAVRNACLAVGLCLLVLFNTERCVFVFYPVWYRCHRPAHLSSVLCGLLWGLGSCLGVVNLLCGSFQLFSCSGIFLVYSVMILFACLMLCVSGLALLVQVLCRSGKRQQTWVSVTTLLRMLAFLLLGLPYGLGHLVYQLSPSLSSKHSVIPVAGILLALNSGVNPFIYFFVKRDKQAELRKPAQRSVPKCQGPCPQTERAVP